MEIVKKIEAQSTSLERFEDRLKEVIERAGGVQIAAQVMDKGIPQVYRYLKGENIPTLPTMAALAEATGISLSWLASGKGTKTLDRQEDRSFTQRVLGEDHDLDEEAVPFIISDGWARKEFNTPNPMIYKVKTDSMEKTICHGDILLVNSEIRKLSDGIFLISLDQQLAIKRVSVSVGKVLLKCDNLKYSSFEVNTDQLHEIQVIGQVIWHGRRL